VKETENERDRERGREGERDEAKTQMERERRYREWTERDGATEGWSDREMENQRIREVEEDRCCRERDGGPERQRYIK